MLFLAGVWFVLVWGRTIFTNDIYPWLGHGLPYADMALALVAAFLLAMLAEFALLRINFTPELRAVVYILLLGVLTISSTLWLAFRLSEIRFELQGLLSIFAINALFGMAVIWLGTLAGNWLWQLNLLR